MPDSPLQFLKLDYASHKDALLQRVKNRWQLVWNDFLSGSFGRVIVDLVAYSTQTLAYVVNRIGNELYIPTMTLRESAVRLGALTGYKLAGPAPASVACEARISSPLAYDVTIAKGTQITSADANNLIYEVAQNYVIFAGSTTPQTAVAQFSAALAGASPGDVQSNIYAIMGASYLDVVDSGVDLTTLVQVGQTFQQTGINGASAYTITGISAATGALSNNRLLIDPAWNSASGVISGQVYDSRITCVQGQTLVESAVTPGVGQANYIYTLTRQPVIDGSVSLTVSGAPWTEVMALAVAAADDTVYEVRTLPSGVSYLIFGDGTFGAQAPAEAQLNVTYRIGGGLVGNVDVNSISTSLIGIVVAPNTPVSVQITNLLSQGSGGADSETVDQARINIPASTQTGQRGVTLPDYAALAKGFRSPQYGQIAQAIAVTRASNTLLEGNLVQIYAWSPGFQGSLTSIPLGMQGQLQSFIQAKATGTDVVLIANGAAVPAPISVRFKALPGFDLPSLTTAGTSAIAAVVNSTAATGAAIELDHLYSTLDAISGVDTVTIATPGGDLAPNSDFQVFTPPSATATSALPLTSAGGIVYTGITDVYPLQPWSFSVSTNGVDYTVLPDTTPGQAQIIGGTLAPYYFGLYAAIPVANAGYVGSYYMATDTDTLYLCSPSGAAYAWISVPIGSASRSIIDLRTGQISLSSPVLLPDFTIRHTVITGYSNERKLSIFASYAAVGGQDTPALRRSIRGAVQATMSGLAAGQSLFTARINGLAASFFNIFDVVAAVPGVDLVNRVALDTSGSTAARIDVDGFTLIVPGDIVLNGSRN